MTTLIDHRNAGPRRIRAARTLTDRAFRSATGAGAMFTLVVLVLIGAFLVIRALPAFHDNGFHFLTTSEWNPDGTEHRSGVLALLYGTAVIAIIALVVSTPVSLLTALFVTEYAPLDLRRPLTTLLDMLAAVPSLIFGVWGFFVLQPHLLHVSEWLASNFGWIPIFDAPDGPYFAASPFIVGVLIAVMLVPTATAVMRDVFLQAPQAEKEAALALGASRWRMIRAVVIPFGRGGIVGGTMLALGRALGESISIAIVISAAFKVSPHILQTGGNSIGANIANRFGDSSPAHGLPALMATGVVLFAVTLLVNSAASLIVRRSRSGSGVEA